MPNSHPTLWHQRGQLPILKYKGAMGGGGDSYSVFAPLLSLQPLSSSWGNCRNSMNHTSYYLFILLTPHYCEFVSTTHYQCKCVNWDLWMPALPSSVFTVNQQSDMLFSQWLKDVNKSVKVNIKESLRLDVWLAGKQDMGSSVMMPRLCSFFPQETENCLTTGAQVAIKTHLFHCAFS